MAQISSCRSGEDPRGGADRHPPDGHDRAGLERRVHLHDAVHAHLRAFADDRAREQRCARRDEGPIADGRAVDVRVRAHHDVRSDHGRMPRTAADHGVLEHHRLTADAHLAVLGGEHRAVQDACAGLDHHVARDDRPGRHRGRGIDARRAAAMLDDHAPTDASTGRSAGTGRLSRSTTTVIVAAVSAASTMCTPTASGGRPLRAW